MADHELNEAERSAVNWRRFTVQFGIKGGDGEQGAGGAIRFSRMELAILRRLLQQEVAGEVIMESSVAFKQFTQIITAMEQFMAERGM